MYTYLHSETDIIKLLSSFDRPVVIDLETTGLDMHRDKILEVQVMPLGAEHVHLFSGDYIQCLKHISPPKIGHNLGFDIKMLYTSGFDARDWKYFDTMLMGHLVDENRESYSLDSYVKELWNDDYKETFWRKYDSYSAAPQEEAHTYAAKDVLFTGRLYSHLLHSCETDSIPFTLIEHVHRLRSALLRTEIEGIRVDTEYLTSLAISLKEKSQNLRNQAKEECKPEVSLIELELWEKEIAGYKTDKGKQGAIRPQFSFDSSKQLADLLYNKLGLPIQKNEKTRNITVDEGALERLTGTHPIIETIKSYRTTNKLYTAFIEGTIERLHNGRIYPEFRVNGTVTGRISHSNPNLGQLPKSGSIRKIYVPDAPKTVLLSADYSQLEVCIEANLTMDPNLTQIFEKGLSKHDITAANLGVSRETAKTLNFALQYWASHFKVAKLLNIPEKEALKIWTSYWNLYQGPKKLKAWSDEQVDLGNPLVNAFGRKRRFELRKRHPWDSDYRQAYNFLIQSTGADCTSRAFYLICDWLKENECGRGWFSIHDEILIEVEADWASRANDKLLEIMVSVGREIGLKIPLKAESSGPQTFWGD